MGLKDTVARLTKTAIELTGDLKVHGTYLSKGVPIYDAATDTYTSAATDVTKTNVPMVIAQFKGYEMEASQLTLVDAKIIIASLDISGITPKETDMITAGGRQWQVMKFNSVPGEAVWLLPVKEG